MKKKLILIIVGIILSFIVLEAGLQFVGLAYSSWKWYKNKVSCEHKGTYKILCLGESTTIIKEYFDDTKDKMKN